MSNWRATSLEQETDPYIYTPVTKTQIRVLVLHPASQESSQLQGELLVVNVDDLPPRQKPFSSETIDATKYVCFEAVSYIWGQGTFTDTLVTPDGFICITASLASILRRLRHHSQLRTYWADGVCINQADVAEKEIQVPLMGLIYSSAVRVLCDVCQNERFDSLLDAMDRYRRRNIRRGVVLGSAVIALSKERSAEIMGVTLPSQEEADAIEEVVMERWSKDFFEFIQLKWFHRLWIVQEFVLGRDVSMVFGRKHIPWRQLWAGVVEYQGAGIPWDGGEFAKAENASLVSSFNSICFIRTCRMIDPDTALGREFNNVVDGLMGGTDMSEAQLSMCIMAGCYKQCTIPRDRYYAILGLVKGGEELHADYTAPMRGITIQFWKRALQLASGGELILIAGMAGQTSGYPSWLRDVSLPDPLGHLWMFGPLGNYRHRSGGSLGTWSARFGESQPDEMITQGYFIDEIVEVSSDEPTEPFDMEAMTIRLQNAMSFFTSGSRTAHPRYPLTGESTQDAAIKAVCDYNALNDDGDFGTLLQLASSLLSVAQAYPNRGAEFGNRIFATFRDKEDVWLKLFTGVYYTKGLRFCKTSKGMFGMLAKEVRVGDSVWVLKGCRLPVILRPSLSELQTFAVVGCGSLYGLMSGEVLHMPAFHCQEVTLR